MPLSIGPAALSPWSSGQGSGLGTRRPGFEPRRRPFFAFSMASRRPRPAIGLQPCHPPLAFRANSGGNQGHLALTFDAQQAQDNHGATPQASPLGHLGINLIWYTKKKNNLYDLIYFVGIGDSNTDCEFRILDWKTGWQSHPSTSNQFLRVSIDS